jgi:hypothetical protein
MIGQGVDGKQVTPRPKGRPGSPQSSGVGAARPNTPAHSRYVISESSQTTTVAAVLATASFVSSMSIIVLSADRSEYGEHRTEIVEGE